MKFWKSKTFAVGVIIICSALLIGLSWMNRQQERRRLAQLRALQQQAAPYEQEIREIQIRQAGEGNFHQHGYIWCDPLLQDIFREGY